MFKMAKNWGQAGKAFSEAANLHSKLGSQHDAATSFVDASNCFKKVENYYSEKLITKIEIKNSNQQVDPNEAVSCLSRAIEIYTEMGRFQIAAKHHQTIAEMYENEGNDLVNFLFNVTSSH